MGYLIFWALTAIAVADLVMGIYLASQAVLALRKRKQIRHWLWLWLSGGPILLCGLMAIFQGGMLLLLIGSIVWAYASVRCHDGPTVPNIDDMRSLYPERYQEGGPPSPKQ